MALVVTLIFSFFGIYIFRYAAAGYSSTEQPGASQQASAGIVQNSASSSDGLVVEDNVLGSGDEVKAGDTISVNYTGMLPDGTKFDSSYDRGEPIEFMVGSGQIIRGFDEGVRGMKIGGKRRLTIPPALGYGANQVGPIPANSTIIFDVELMKISQ